MKLVFLATIWLVYVGICYSDLTYDSKSSLESLYDKITEEILSTLARTHSHSLHRQKRDLSSRGKLHLDDDAGIYRLKSVKPVAELCYPAIQTIFVNVSNVTYAICLSDATLDKPAQLVIGYYREHTWTQFHHQFVNDSTNAAAFNFNRNLYVLLADSGIEKGTTLMRIDLDTQFAILDHKIQSTYPKSLAVWEMKMFGKYHLAIASRNKNALDTSTEITVYEWKDTYFDPYTSFPAYDVKDIEPFHIYGAAYIAIANFKKSRSEPHVDSEIYRYDMDNNIWISHQRIKTYGAMDWEFFALGESLGQEFFLAVANYGNGDSDAKSTIYKFIGDKFSPFQCLPTTKATSIASLSKNGMFLLAVANENDAVHFYQYNGWRFVQSTVQYTTGAMSSGVKQLVFHTVLRSSEKVQILSVSNPIRPRYQSVFELGFQHENSLRQWNSRSEEWCLKVLNKIESSDIAKTVGNFDDVIFTDQPSVTINGDLVFEQGFVAENLKTPTLQEIKTKEVFDNEFLHKLADLHARLEILQKKLNEIAAYLQKALKIDGKQNVTGQLKFEDVVFDCENCHFEKVNTDILNSENIENWMHELVFLDSSQVINGTIMAQGISAPSVHVSGHIDGVNSQSLVTKSGRHEITGHKTFDDIIITKNLKVSGLVDGVSVSANNVLLTSGHQRISGKLTFTNITTSWLDVSLVNNKNLSSFYDEMILTDKPAIITGEKTFGDVIIKDLSMSPGSLINGIDVADLWKNTLWKEGKQVIDAELTFSNIAIADDLDVPKGINGIQIPGPRVVDITEPAIVTAPHTFRNASLDSLEVTHSLNNMPLVQNPDGSKVLDIMLKTGNQLITGKKVFHTIHLDEDSDVKGTVDGVDLSEFKTSVLSKTDTVSNGTWVFTNMVTRSSLNVDGKISNLSLKDIYDRALKLNDSEVSEINFNEVVKVEALTSDDINGINVKKDLVLINEEQVLTGTKKFEEIVLDANSLINGLVNGKDISFLNEILLKIGNQALKSKAFKKDIKMNDLIVTGKINGIPVDDILTLNGGIVFGSRILENVTFTKIDAKNVELSGKVNNIDIQQMMDDTMTYDDSQDVTGTKDFKGTIYILENGNFQAKDLNEIDLNKLLEDAVFVDVDAEIHGKKKFTADTAFNNMYFDKTIDGVSEWDLKYNWMLKSLPQVVEGNVLFKNGFSTKNLNAHLINGVNINDLSMSIVKVNEATEIKGPVIFSNLVLSNGNVTLTGTIQNVDLSEEAVLRDGIIVTGPKTFAHDVVVKSDLTVDGLVDGVKIDNVCSKTLFTNKEQNLSHLTIKGDVMILEGGIVGGNFGGVDLKSLKDIAAEIKDSRLKFSGLKNFSNVVFDGPVTLKGKFGNIYLNELQNYMSLTLFQEINENIDFHDVQFNGTLSAQNLDTHTKEINNINLLKLFNSVLKTDGTQKVTAKYNIDEVIFEDDVFVAGKVNDCDVPGGLMRKNHINYIESPKIFEKPLIIHGNLQIEKGKTIQNVDVSDWFQKAVLNEGKFSLSGHKSFVQLQVNNAWIEGNLNEMKISEDSLLMTYGIQAVTGRKTIDGKVDIEKALNVDGLINNINLTELSENTLQRDKNNTLTGYKFFNNPLTVVSLHAPSVDGINIENLEEKLHTTLDYTMMENKLSDIEGVVAHMQEAFDSQAVLFQYYELFQEFEISTAYNWLHVVGNDVKELMLLSDNSSSVPPCSSIRIFGYDTDGFIPARQEILTTYAISVKSLELWNSTYLFVANRNPNAACSNEQKIGEITVDIYVWNIDAFKKVQSLPVNYVEDMVAFKDGDEACIVILEFNSSKVYCALQNRSFDFHETLHTTGGRKASVIQTMGKIILAISSEDIYTQRQNHFDGKRFVDIYVWKSETTEFSAPIQDLQSTFVQSISLMKHKDEYSENLFLLITEGSIPKIYNEPKILIYRYEKSKSHPFQKYQEIKDYGVTEWITLATGELIFFAVDSQRGQIKIYQYKGVSGFVKIDTIQSVGTTSVHAFVRPHTKDRLNHYLALAGPHAVMAQPTQGVDYAKILKSKNKGKR